MTTQRTPRSRLDTRVGVGAVGAIGVALMTIALVLITVVLGAAILEFWPPECPGSDEPAGTPSASPGPSPEPSASPAPGTGTSTLVCPPDPASPAKFGFWGLSVSLNREQNLLLLVALLGALGSMGHVLRSFFRYVGERKLVWSWISMYFMTPLVGAILAVLTYIILRAGLLGTAGGGALVGNTWGFAAIAALVGLFSAQAAAKLKQVFETLFSPAEQGTESLDTVLALSIRSFAPKTASVGDEIEIKGDDLETVRGVLFSGDEESPATYNDARAVLVVRVPKGAVTGPLTVGVGKEKVTSTEDLTITDTALNGGTT